MKIFQLQAVVLILEFAVTPPMLSMMVEKAGFVEQVLAGDKDCRRRGDESDRLITG
jgi:hypothetical protein